MRRALAAALAVGLAGCGCEHGVFADHRPIAIDLTTGAVVINVGEAGQAPRPAVIDLLAPFTVVEAAADAPPSRRCTDLTLYQGDVPRAHLDLTVTALPPQGDTAGAAALIGGDAFSGAALRLDFAGSSMTILPDIAGSAQARGELCEAQFPDPFRGGGTLFIGGTEVSFPARRIAIGACLSYETAVAGDTPADDAAPLDDRGADVQLVLSTGIGTTILSESAYARWRAASGLGGDVATLPAGAVTLPYWGAIAGKIGTVDRIALVGYHEDRRGPCRQVYAHHLLAGRVGGCAEGDDCPCLEDSFCRVPSVVELADPVEVLIVPDDLDVLQALRAELRPRVAEIDGILGTDALAPTSLDVDPRNNRLLFRCAAAGCTSRPELITVKTVRDVVPECLDLAAPPDVTIPATAWSGNR